MADKNLYILAGYDDETEQKLEAWQQSLFDKGFSGTQTNGIPMHFTIGSYATDREEELKERLLQVAKTHRASAAEFNHIGLFTLGDNAVLFLAPEITPEILALKDCFRDNHDIYNWSAHNTLLIDKKDVIRDALKTVMDEFVPFSGKVSRLYLYEFWPTRHIMTVELTEGETFLPVDDLRDEEIFLQLNHTADADPAKQFVPAYHFDICLLDGTKIGKCDLRIGHNDKLYIGGNIGYTIDEPYRGHRYAAKACQLLFKQARKHGLGYVIITCVPGNDASARTCELVGGTYLETVDIPEDNEMYAEGKRQVKVYRFNINA